MEADHTFLMTLGLIALALEFLGIIAAAVWAVSKIRSTTEMLRVEIHALGEDIKQLQRVIKTIEERQWTQQEAIARLQAHHEISGPRARATK